jgi:hypothetical protein
VIEVSAAILRPGLSLPREAQIVYLSWDAALPLQIYRPGHVSGWLRSWTCHLSRRKTH